MVDFGAFLGEVATVRKGRQGGRCKRQLLMGVGPSALPRGRGGENLGFFFYTT